jgi:hypothetical protein
MPRPRRRISQNRSISPWYVPEDRAVSFNLTAEYYLQRITIL